MANKKQIEKKLIKAKDKLWADTIKKGCNNKCVICGDTKRLNAHHILPRQLKEYRWDLRNGIALCPKHHRFSFDFSAHQNSFRFYLWLQLNEPHIFNYLRGVCNGL